MRALSTALGLPLRIWNCLVLFMLGVADSAAIRELATAKASLEAKTQECERLQAEATILKMQVEGQTRVVEVLKQHADFLSAQFAAKRERVIAGGTPRPRE